MKSLDSIKLGLVSVVAVVGIIIMTFLSANNLEGYYGFASKGKGGGSIAISPSLSFEAESGTSQGFLIGQDPKASEQQYVYSPDGSGSVSYSFNVEKSGLYKISTKVSTPSPYAQHNSFYVQLDNQERVLVDAQNSGENFKWNAVSTLTKDSWVLEPGTHTIMIEAVEPNVKIDSVALAFTASQCADNDKDGYGRPASELCQYNAVDCNDRNPNINPGAAESCENRKDDNCDGRVNEGCAGECVDADNDGYGENCNNGADCDDNDPNIHTTINCAYNGNQCGNFNLCQAVCPTTPEEVCGNNVDEDCNGIAETCPQSSGLSRSFPENIISPNSNVTITITKNLQPGQSTLLTEEYVPDEFTILNAGTGVVTGHTIRWAELTGAQSGTYTYTVRTPINPDVYTFSGAYTINGGSSQSIGGEQELEVVDTNSMILLFSMGETKTILLNGQTHVLSLTGYDMENLGNNWQNTVHMTINGNPFSIRENEYLEVSGVPLYAQDIFISNIGQNDVSIQLRILHDSCNIYNNNCNGNVCGDGILIPSEQCDTTQGFGDCSVLGYNSGYFSCSQCMVQNTCYNTTYEPVCGNEYRDVEAQEECDGSDIGYINNLYVPLNVSVTRTISIDGIPYQITYLVGNSNHQSILIKIDNETKTIQHHQNRVVRGLTVSFETYNSQQISLIVKTNPHTCQSLGHTGGTLACYDAGTPQECTYDYSACIGATVFPTNTLVQAESGNNNGFTIQNGYVFTGTDEANSISYAFNVPTAGQYVVMTGIVNADVSSNSFYVGADGFNAAGNTAYTYDTIEGAGTINGTVRLRGPNGNYSWWQFDPMVYDFAVGTHTITFYGREYNTKMDYLMLKTYSAPACSNGQTQSCITGLQGVCAAGTQTCSNNVWGSCVQNVQPSTEICGNGIDEDCNGVDLVCVGGGNLSRSFSGNPVNANTTVTVTITKTLLAGQSTLLTEEYVPAGFTILNAGSGTATGNTIRWAELTGAQSGTYIYTVRTPTTAGSYNFSGLYSINGGATMSIGGSTLLTVQGAQACTNGQTQSCITGLQGVCAAGTQTCSNNVWGSCVQNVQPSAEICGNGIDEDCNGADLTCQNATATLSRSFSGNPVNANTTVTVTITKTLLAGQSTLLTEEYVPAGFTILNAGSGTATGNTIRWAELTGATSGTYTYTVRSPLTSGNYTFSGIYTINGGATMSIVGNTLLTVQGAQACSNGQIQNCSTGQQGACAMGTRTCSNNQWGSCIAPTPTIEVCNNDIDEDCDGTLNNGCAGFCDTDGDTHNQQLLLWCIIYGPIDDCNDNNANIYPGATEICGNGIDEDCSGSDLTCPNTPPIVSISSPANGSTFNSGSNITVVALASDPNGSISKVEFYRNNALAGTDMTFPYSYAWNNAAIGNYTIYARAYDNLNATANSIPITIYVVQSEYCGNGICSATESCNTCVADCGSCPLALSRGFSSSTVNGSANITVTITKNLQPGQSTLLTEEYVPAGFTILNAGTGTATGNTIRWAELTGAQSGTYIYTVRTPLTPGNYTFSGLYSINGGATMSIGGSTLLIVQGAQACTNGQSQSCTTGLLGVCAAGTQTCSNNVWGSCVQNVQPSTEICGNGVDEDCNGADLQCNTAPSVNAGNDLSVVLPNSVTLNGIVTDDGLPNPPGLTTVRWTRQSGPGTVTFSNQNARNTTATFSTNGTYVLRLTANDSILTAYDTLTVTASPQPINIPPAVSIFSPSNGTNYAYPSYVIINATASDSDGTISRVEFYTDGILRSTDTTLPYSYIWTNASIGTHILAAKAYDNQNASTTSSPVTIGMIQPVCTNGQTQSCTTGLLGICSAGIATCSNNNWGPCVQNNQPTTEICGNGIDENCDGVDQLCTINGLSRSFSENPTSVLSNVIVTITKTLNAGESTLLTEEYVPAGFTILNAGTGTVTGNTIRWAELIGATSGTYTYTVQTPGATGDYGFSGVYAINGGSVLTISGDAQLTVR